MEIEIKSRSTGQVVYSFEGTFEDWDFKKKMLLMGRDEDIKIMSYINKYGIADLIALPVPEKLKEVKPKIVKPKKPKVVKPKETEIIEPEIVKKVFKRK